MTDSAQISPPDAEVPHFGKAYSSAHKAYGLASALLIAWELIGVELDASPVENFKVTLKSPQAAPYVLIALIFYFAFRMTIEWYQTDLRRRKLRASRIDFVVAHIIGAIALSLYAYQTLAKVQIVDILPRHSLVFFLCGVSLGQVVFFLTIDPGWKGSRLLILVSAAVIVFMGTTTTWITIHDLTDFRPPLISAAIGFLVGMGVTFVVNPFRKRS